MSDPIRVTEVLNYFKEPWYVDWVCRVGKREANRVSKHAQKIGTRVDEIIKNNSFPTLKDKDEVINCINAYRKWKDVYKPKCIVPGTRLFATIDGVEVTGEPDLFVDDVLVDIKCSSKISPSYWVQVNMYEYLSHKTDVNRLTYDYKKVAILRLDKVSGSYEYVVKDYDTSLVDVWLGMCRAYRYFNREVSDGSGDEL